MDIGEITTSFPDLTELNTSITYKIEKAVQERLTHILTTIAEQEQIPREKLFAKYLHMDINIKCTAVIGKGRQCTRKKKIGNFCATHAGGE